ncbi:MAG: type VI secretion system tip protein TssI/VgrG [Sandaracinaceae bacterium]
MADTVPVELRFEAEATADVTWVVRAATLREALNTPFSLALEISTDQLDAEPVRLLGTAASFTVTRADFTRTVSGIVASLTEGPEAQDDPEGDRLTVRLVLRPALEALRYRVNTRLFQDVAVPDVLDEVLTAALGGYGRSVDARLSRTYPICEYRTQHDESDLAFCHRLMEEEGIVYWFEEGDAETLVLADAGAEYATLEPAEGGALEFRLRVGDRVGTEHVSVFEPRSQIVPTTLVTRHFDWTRPSAPIEGASSDAPPDAPSGAHIDPPREVYAHGHAPLSLSEFDGTAYGASDVEDQVRLRREAHAFDAKIVDGRSTVSALRPGGRFDLSGHPLQDLDRGWAVLSVEHCFGRDGGEDGYFNTFRCFPDDVPYRPARVTPRPRVESALTARVVGPAGEEIHTDAHGRVRVQLHWDRQGAMDEHSTRWVRVMQPWAGAGWGHVFIPRMGMEVVVEFVDGDPDQPLVVGALYDGEHATPHALPDDKTKSTIRTETSIGGGGNNELTFEDAAGSELVYVHAQKDFDEVVENDHTTTVHHDQSIHVDNDQTQEIGNDQTEHVFNDQDLTVDANRSVTVHGSFTETIDGSETKTVSSGSTETITGGETRTVTGGMTESIAGGRTQTITASSTESVSGALSQTVNGSIVITTPSTYEVTAVGGFSITTPGATTLIAPGGYSLLAPGGQTSIDESWFSLGNKWFDNYGVKGTTVVTKIDVVYAMQAAAQVCTIDAFGAKLTTGGAFEEFSGAKAETTGAKLKSYAGALLFAGLFNKT